MLTEWDSALFGVRMGLRTITRDGMLATTYDAGTVHDGTEGELYDLVDDPLQLVNRWDDPAWRAQRVDLLDDLRASLPAAPTPAPPTRGAGVTEPLRHRRSPCRSKSDGVLESGS